MGCDIPIADDSVSRIHAEVAVLPDGQLIVTDNHSRNGTAVIRNGRPEPIQEARVSRSDRVQFGDVVLGVADLLESLERKLPARASVASAPMTEVPESPAGALANGRDPIKPYVESIGSVIRRRWRESIICALVLSALVILAIDAQSQGSKFIVGIMGSVIASLVLSMVQQFWQKK
jgi:pSer/pThr/pTyr-binding forkhead associated (FHA) protein